MREAEPGGYGWALFGTCCPTTGAVLAVLGLGTGGYDGGDSHTCVV